MSFASQNGTSTGSQTGYSFDGSDDMPEFEDLYPPYRDVGYADLDTLGLDLSGHDHVPPMTRRGPSGSMPITQHGNESHGKTQLAHAGATSRLDSPSRSSEGDGAVNAFKSPLSAQEEIASSRSNVRPRFGQVTPPDDKSLVGVAESPPDGLELPAPDEPYAQRHRQERAHNTSHPRNGRNGESNASMAGSEEAEDKKEKYREKNRVAAAKCRSKKKANVNGLEERHRAMAAENNFRRREERELRDELTALRTMALEHGPGRCDCGGLHSYNQSKADEMALGHRMGVAPLADPTHEGASSIGSPQPAIFSPYPRQASSNSPVQEHDLRQCGYMPQQSAYLQQLGSDPGSAVLSGSFADTMGDHHTEFPVPQDDFAGFADFLQSSPGSRGGLS